MKVNEKIDQVDTASNRSTSYFWLDSTLEHYEVEELDGYELAKFLSQYPMGAANQGQFTDGGSSD